MEQAIKMADVTETGINVENATTPTGISTGRVYTENVDGITRRYLDRERGDCLRKRLRMSLDGEMGEFC